MGIILKVCTRLVRVVKNSIVSPLSLRGRSTVVSNVSTYIEKYQYGIKDSKAYIFLQAQNSKKGFVTPQPLNLKKATDGKVTKWGILGFTTGLKENLASRVSVSIAGLKKLRDSIGQTRVDFTNVNYQIGNVCV